MRVSGWPEQFDARVGVTTHGGGSGPFAQLTVADLSDRLAAAFAARLFGDFGADVVLCEPEGGHPLRREAPFAADAGGTEHSAVHALVNWNKRSQLAEDTTLSELVASADVVVTDCLLVPGTPVAAALAMLRPDAVHLSVTPHGLDSPLTGTPGNNLTASARTGWSSVNGYRDEPPLQLPGNQAGYIAGLAGFVAAAAALRRRRDSPQAELVDVSELEAFALTVHPWGVAAVYEGGDSPARTTGRPAAGQDRCTTPLTGA